jgi:glycosyltransferase involved in cell wall biosynthesis
MLSSWALEHHKVRKAIAWTVFQRSDLLTANLVHVTSPAEADEVRALGCQLPLAIIPNGVDLPLLREYGHDSINKPKQALFLSRLHPKKGLSNLIEAWAVTAGRNWRLIIAGPDAGGERAAAQSLAEKLGLRENVVRFVGPIADKDKWDLYAASDLFILPSFSENFGIVIAEALASGVPVITTKATPWRELIDHDCGWWIDVGVEPLVCALRQALLLSDADRRAMGLRGRGFVAREYSWSGIAGKMARAYRWLLGTGEMPPFVFQA